MPFYAYMLQCADGTYYTGHTDDLDRRIAEHQSGAIKGYTSKRRPVELVWSESFPSRIEAVEAEFLIGGWSRKKKVAFLRQDWTAVSRAAVPPSEREQRASASLGAGPRLRSDQMEENMLATAPPIIILVRPQLGQNIGKAARAMLNFGLAEMRLVEPRDGWPNPEAGPAASGADIVLERAEVFGTVAEAIADCSTVFASTVRRRELVLPVVGPAEMATRIQGTAGRSAILFGPERSGLATEDVAHANAIVTVPINPDFGSLNLAQAVILLAYEWSRTQALQQPTAREMEPAAPHAEVEGMIGQIEEALDAAGYFYPPERTAATKATLRTIFTKPGWSSREIKAVRGLMKALVHPRRIERG